MHRLLLTLPPRTRRLTVDVLPVPARVSVDGKPLGEGPTNSITAEVEFRFVGAAGVNVGFAQRDAVVARGFFRRAGVVGGPREPVVGERRACPS